MYLRLLAIIVMLAVTPSGALAKENSPQSVSKSKAKIKKPAIKKTAKKPSKTQTKQPAPILKKVEPPKPIKVLTPPVQKPIAATPVKAPQIPIPAPAKYITNMEDEADLLQIVSLGSNQQWFDASEIAKNCKDPKFADSLIQVLKIYYNPQSLPIKEISDFFNENKWVSIEPFNNKIEKSISYDNTPGSVIEWFKDKEPQTNSGKFSLLHAAITVGSTSLTDSNTKKNIRELWRTTEFDLNTEEYYLKKYKDHLTIEDLLKKIEFLTWNKSYTYANQLLSILPTQYRKVPKARLEIAQSKFSLQRTLSGATEQLMQDDYIKYAIISNLLDNDKESAALHKLLEVKPKAGFDRWWKLKNIAIRNALRDETYDKAYALTVDHNLEYGPDMAEAEWLGGWISLRFLNNPEQAAKRFEILYNNTKLASSKSKGAYWLARSFEAHGDTENANKWYEIASQYKGTFYGHLAIAAKHGDTHYNYFENVAHTTDKRGNYTHKEHAKKLTYFAYLLHKADVRILANNLIATIADFDLDRSDLEVSALYFTNRKYYPLAVEIAKSSSNKGAPLLREGYPRHIEVSGNNLPKGIYLGIMRQESLFDPHALSPAGARGLMQLMPATASRMAKIIGAPKEAFASDPSSNVRQGVTYFDQLHKQYGNIPLAIAAYNAGPGNVNKWLTRNGDPRKSNDPYVMIDWIELIPFNETRNYVKKVLENYVVYDSILDDNHAPKAILSFLEN
jgi:soluble lytic murein transglycosylase